ncbi:TIGR02996 domain-containing protein [Pyxidicoccus sp. 3LFB2]
MAIPTLSELLGLALESFERHEEAAALEHLLGAWRQTRAEPLAVLIERLSARLTGGLPPLQADTHAQLFKRFRPVDLPRVLAHVVVLADQRQWDVVGYLLDGVRQLPADPRFTAPLLDLVQRPDAFEQRVFRTFCYAFSAMRDPRALEPLRAVRKTLSPGSGQAEGLDLALRSFVPEVSLDDEDAATCAALERALTSREAAETRRSPTHEALLARVYADPGDTAARMVLADHLLEQGHPQGELIMLQCTPHADADRSARLVEEHGWRWALALGPHVEAESTRFERGLPAAVRLSPGWREPLPEPGPEWATVREVDAAGTLFPGLAEWLAHPRLRRVTVLRRVEPTLAWGFGARELGVRQLGLLGPVSRKAPVLFSELERLPHLARLLIHDAEPEDVQLCAASLFASRLERFEARGLERTWALVVRPAKDVPMRATLLGEAGVEPLARVLRGAVGFGRGALHVRVRKRTTPEGLRLLRAAVSPYARVEWS